MYGIDGAAIASLISLICVNYLFDVTLKKTKFIFTQKTKALFFLWVFPKIKSI